MIRSRFARNEEPVSVTSTIASASVGGFTSVAPHAPHSEPSPAPAPACTQSPHRPRKGSSSARSRRSSIPRARTAQSSHPADCPWESPASASWSTSLVPFHNRFRKAAHRALVAHQTIALNLDLEQQGIVVAIGRSLHHPQPVAAGLALHPQLAPRPAPEGHKPRLQRLRIAHLIQKPEHQHLARLRILHDPRDQAIHLRKVNLHSIHLSTSPLIRLIRRQSKKKGPLAVCASAGLSDP